LKKSIIDTEIYQSDVLKSVQDQVDKLITTSIPNAFKMIKQSSDKDKDNDIIKDNPSVEIKIPLSKSSLVKGNPRMEIKTPLSKSNPIKDFKVIPSAQIESSLPKPSHTKANPSMDMKTPRPKPIAIIDSLSMEMETPGPQSNAIKAIHRMEMNTPRPQTSAGIAIPNMEIKTPRPQTSAIIAIPNLGKDIPLPKSTILKNEHMLLFQKWIPKKFTKLEPLYRGSRDEFTAASFHKKCDNMGATITVIVSQKYGKTFGGYTEVVWDSVSFDKSDPNSFLFSLSTGEKLKHKKSACGGIICHADSLCVFGAGTGCDIQIYDMSNMHSWNKASIGHCFCLPQGYSDLHQARNYLAGEECFKVQEIEVFQVIFG
jgi:hypothetical protein